MTTGTLSLTLFLAPSTVYTLPLCDRDGISVPLTTQGTMSRMTSGTLRADIIATKADISIRWSLLPKTSRDNLMTAWLAVRTAVAELLLPSGTSYYVMAAVNGWEETQFYDTAGVPWYTITVKFSEV